MWRVVGVRVGLPRHDLEDSNRYHNLGNGEYSNKKERKGIVIDVNKDSRKFRDCTHKETCDCFGSKIDQAGDGNDGSSLKRINEAGGKVLERLWLGSLMRSATSISKRL